MANSICIESKKKNITNNDMDAPKGRHNACIVSNVCTSKTVKQTEEEKKIKEIWIIWKKGLITDRLVVKQNRSAFNEYFRQKYSIKEKIKQR